MGRRRSDYICPKCGEQGSLEKNPYRRVIHYNSVTGKRERHYVEKILNDRQIKVNKLKFKKTFFKMSPIELQQHAIELANKHPHNRHERNEMKAEREALEFTAIKRKIRLPRYRKVSASVTPKILQGESSLYNEVKGLSQDYLKIYKILDKISKRIYQYKPEKELSDQLAHNVSIFRQGVMNTQKILFVPYSDLRWSLDWVKWIDVCLAQIEQSKGYAASRRALEGGEYPVKLLDDSEIRLKNKVMSTKQIAKKEPEILKMTQQMMIGIPMIEALHTYSYQTEVFEEYDEQGNLIK